MRRLLVLVAALLATSARAAPPLRVAVLEFANGGAAGPETDALGSGLQSMITTDLAHVGAFQLIERARLADLRAELALGRSGLVDPKAAARIGKLLGATHLVAGTYTIAGGRMRLDGRLFAVADGRILLAESSEGERDAFFELEKDLVKKVIQAAGVTVAPKERAEVARIHTADFEAFRKFSQGVKLFDDKRYDEAVAALRDAQRRDGDFRLAASTLGEYERVVAELRGKADRIDRSEEEVRALQQDRAAADFIAMIDKLEALAARPGAGAQVERMAALLALADFYDAPKVDRNNDRNLLWEVRDFFALRRAADAARRRYFAEWVEAFPRLHVRLGLQRSHSGWLHPRSFAADWKAYVAAWSKERPGDNGGDWEQRSAFGSMELDAVARLLDLDRREEVKLRRTVLASYGGVGAPAEWRRAEELELARNLRAIDALAESTAILTRLASAETDAGRLRDLADEVERNRALEAARAAPARPSTAEEAYKLSELSTLPPWEEGHIFLGASPAWSVRGDPHDLTTGRRADELAARALRYARQFQGSDGVLVVLDGTPRRDVAVDLTVSFDPPDDWWPPGHAPFGRDQPLPATQVRPRVEGRAEVAFAFGVRDVDARSRPMRGLELVVGPDAVRLVETEESGDRDHRRTAVRALAEKPLGLGAERRLAVAIRVAGTTVTATVNGKTVELPVPAERTGFYGVAFRGAGFAAVSDWKTVTPR